MPPKSVLSRMCAKCSVAVRGAVTCVKCSRSYHSSCILLIPGTSVKSNGSVVCCDDVARGCEQCSVRDREMLELRARLSIINERDLDRSLAGLESAVGEEAMSERLQLEMAEMRRYLREMHSELARGISELVDAFRELRADVGMLVSHRPVDVSDVLSDADRRDASMVVDTVVEDSDEPVSSRRVAIFSDGHGGGCASVLSDILGCTYDVSGNVLRTAVLDDVVRDVKSLTRDYTKQDFVVLMCGTNDVRRDCSISTSTGSDLCDVASQTNLIILSVPFHEKDLIFNRRAFKFNCALYNLMGAERISNYVECNSLLTGKNTTRQHTRLTRNDKRKIMNYVSKVITNLIVNVNCIHNNLIYIDTVDVDTADLDISIMNVDTCKTNVAELLLNTNIDTVELDRDPADLTVDTVDVAVLDGTVESISDSSSFLLSVTADSPSS